MSVKNVLISGINGRMGRLTANLLAGNPDFKLTLALGKAKASYIGQNLGKYLNIEAFNNLIITDKIDFTQEKIDIVIDFTDREFCLELGLMAVSHKIPFVTGTSGITSDILVKFNQAVREYDTPILIVPNFSLGAVLMIEFASQASKWFDNVEIIELHDPQKTDAPSGTALYTIDKMESLAKQFNVSSTQEHELIESVRGGKSKSGIRVHSLRLPGLISHQEVDFGSGGELLKITHSSFNTNCFSKGIMLALNKVTNLQGLTRGLENILTID